MAPKRSKRPKVLEIFNSWEKKPERFFFELGQKYPTALLVSSYDFGWIVYEGSGDGKFSSKEYDKALLKFLEKNPKYLEGQDITPDEDDDGF